MTEKTGLIGLTEVGYMAFYGPDIAVNGKVPDRTRWFWVGHLCNAINRLNSQALQLLLFRCPVRNQ